MPRSWVVLMEVTGVGRWAIDREGLSRLLDVLDPAGAGGALHSADRYALQLPTRAAGPTEALREVLGRWGTALGQLGLPAGEIVRTEVLTPDELERDFEDHRHDETIVPRSAIQAHPSDDELGDELLRRAFSDPFTGLLGREAFEYRLDAALGRIGAQARTAVLRLDLDHFGALNDRLGDAVGDQVLLAVAQRLAARLRPADVLARFGADEFAVLLHEVSETACTAVAERLLDAVRRPLTILGHRVTVTASAGAVVAARGDDAQTLLGQADAALAWARDAGGGAQVVFGPPPVGPPPPAPSRPGVDPLQDRLAHLLLLQEAAVAANEAETLQEAAAVVMGQLCAHADCSLSRLWIVPGDATAAGPPIWHVAGPGDYVAFQALSDNLAVVSGIDLPGRVWAGGRPVWVTDLAADPGWLRRAPGLAAGLASGFAFPVRAGLDVVAVVEVFSRAPLAPTASFVDVVASIGTQLGRVVERQRAAAALRRSADELAVAHARLGQACALARLGHWHYDLATGESTWSPEMYRLCGLEPAGPAPDLDAALAQLHPADRARAGATLARLVELGGRVAEEVRMVGPDGTLRWHRAEGAVISDETGRVVAIYGTSQDITERKVAEERLRERDRRLSAAYRVAGLGWWELDVSSGQLTCSDEVYRLWGWEPGAARPLEAFLATIEPRHRRRLVAATARARQRGDTLAVDVRATVADGQRRWFRSRAELRADDTAMTLVGTVQDITNEKQADHDRQAARDLYRRIVESAHEGIWTVDAAGITTFVNARMAQIVGYSAEEMVGLPATAFVDDQTRAALGVYRRRRRAGVSEHFEAALRAKEGALVPVLISASPLLDDKGDYGGALAMVTDVSAPGQAEELLRVHGAGGREEPQPATETPPTSVEAP